MGDGYKVTLNRPDGSQINVDSVDVEQFKALGYSPETAEERYSRSIQQAEKEHFESTEQKVITGVQGFVSGLTLGAPEISGHIDEDDRQRARYNPGTRLAGEIAGMLLPSALVPGSGLAKIATATPTGLLTRGAELAAEGLTKTRIGHSIVRGAIEGGVQGASAAAVNARLNGEPINAEAVLAGAGWGAVFGGGIGGLSSKFGVYTEKLAAERRVAAEVAEHGAIAPEKWALFRGSIDDARKVSATALRDASAAVPEVTSELTERIIQRAQEAESAQKTLFNEIDAKGGFGGKGWQRGLKNEVLELRAKTREALKAEPGNYARFEELANKHAEAMTTLAQAAGASTPDLQPFAVAAKRTGSKAIEELKGLKAVSDVLEKFPSTPEGFAAMKPKSAEKQIAAVEKFLKGNAPELSGVRESVAKAVDDLMNDAGLTMAGATTPGAKLRGVYEATRAAAKEGRAVTSSGGGMLQSAGRYAGGRVAASAAGKAGGGVLGRGLAFSAGAKIVGGLLDMKSAVLGTITNSVHKWGPGVAKVGEKLAPRIDPLRTRLDGTIDGDKADRKTLMAARAKEIRDAAPTIRDNIYQGLEPLVANHGDLAASMNRVAVQQFDALLQRLPRDPATAFSNMKSLWKPDFIETERFARAYEVFHNPVGTAVKWLANPRSITPEGAHAMRDMNPELWTHLRVEMLNRLSGPGVLEKMSYSEQVGLGQLLNITIHSTQDPRFIKAQQEMFSERNEPLPVKPSGAQNNSNNPSGVSRGMTAAQRITEH